MAEPRVVAPGELAPVLGIKVLWGARMSVAPFTLERDGRPGHMGIPRSAASAKNGLEGAHLMSLMRGTISQNRHDVKACGGGVGPGGGIRDAAGRRTGRP